MLKLTLSLLLLFSLALCVESFAQAQKQAPVTEYDFEADDFTATVRSPEGLTLNGEQRRKLNSLITIRKDFKREIIKAADGI